MSDAKATETSTAQAVAKTAAATPKSTSTAARKTAAEKQSTKATPAPKAEAATQHIADQVKALPRNRVWPD